MLNIITVISIKILNKTDIVLKITVLSSVKSKRFHHTELYSSGKRKGEIVVTDLIDLLCV